jgi:NarL family two-component system response regulator LiaR
MEQVAQQAAAPRPEAARSGAPDQLTARELEVIQQVAHGHSNHEIAQALVISEKTVKTHISNILGKLHLEDRTQLAIYAIKHGLVGPE